MVCHSQPQKPSDYLKSRNIFISCEAEERLLPATLDIIGEDIVVFASDFPHWDTEFPANLEHLRNRQDLSDSQKEKILGLNARKLVEEKYNEKIIINKYNSIVKNICN